MRSTSYTSFVCVRVCVAFASGKFRNKCGESLQLRIDFPSEERYHLSEYGRREYVMMRTCGGK